MSSPAYRATLLQIRWAQVKSALTFLHFACTSSYITCRRLRDFYGETMGKYGQSYGQVSLKFMITTKIEKLDHIHSIGVEHVSVPPDTL